MKPNESELKPKKKAWQQVEPRMVKYVPSGTYYARFRSMGKLIWKSLDTDSVTVARDRLKDLIKTEGDRAKQGRSLASGKVLMGSALKAYEENRYRPVRSAMSHQKKARVRLKPASIAYYEQRVEALKKSWLGFEQLEIGKLTEDQCEAWGNRAREKMSATAFNHTLGVLRNIIDFGVRAGARYDNPARMIERESEADTKVPSLPSTKQFEAFLKEIENSGSGWSKPCADLVRFLAFGGFRKTEAANISFSDCDFEHGQITVRGHPETGLKNRSVGEVRHVPMIDEMRDLLERIKAERPEAKPTDKVMLVNECQGAMDRAAAAKDVQMARIRHHDLRHLWATRCIESGVDIRTLSEWMGHSDKGALCMKIYGHLRNEHSIAMAKRVRFSKAPALL